jgi:hypothetical protein
MASMFNPTSDFYGSKKSKTTAGQSILGNKRPQPMKLKDPVFDPNRQVLYRNFHEIGLKFKVVYLVEISRNKHKIFVILFPNFERPDIYMHTILSYKIGEKLLSYVDNIFEEFIKTIDVKFGKIVMKNYHTRPRNLPPRPQVHEYVNSMFTTTNRLLEEVPLPE